MLVCLFVIFSCYTIFSCRHYIVICAKAASVEHHIKWSVVCVCVCEEGRKTGREREREGGREGGRRRKGKGGGRGEEEGQCVY